LRYARARRHRRCARRRAPAPGRRTLARQHLSQRIGPPGLARAVDVAGLRHRPGTGRGPAAVGVAGILRADAPGGRAARSHRQQRPATGAVRGTDPAAPHRTRACRSTAPVVALGAGRHGDRDRHAAGGAACATRRRGGGAAVLGPVHLARRADAVHLVLHRASLRLEQPQPVAVRPAVPAVAAGRLAGRTGARGGYLVRTLAVRDGRLYGLRAVPALVSRGAATHRAVKRDSDAVHLSPAFGTATALYSTPIL